MHTILFLRHAYADSAVPVADHERRLSSKGKKDASLMAKQLAKEGYKPDLIISSSAVRAVITAETFGNALDRGFEIDKYLYNTDERSVMDLLHSIDEKVKDLMLVGHNPTLEMIVEMLTGRQIKMRPCSIVQISFESAWSKIKEGKIIYQADTV